LAHLERFSDIIPNPGKSKIVQGSFFAKWTIPSRDGLRPYTKRTIPAPRPGVAQDGVQTQRRPVCHRADCELFIAEMILYSPSGRGYYPDQFLSCEQPNGEMHFTNLACWVIEVLSETTEAIDRSEKLQNYTAIPAIIVLCFWYPRTNP